MDDECVSQLGLSVVKTASAEMASPAAPAEERPKAFRFVLGARRPNHLIKAVSPHVTSGLVRRGLANPGANQVARKLRAGLREKWCAVGG